MLIRPEGCNMRCADARCRSRCRKIVDWERQHASELSKYGPASRHPPRRESSRDTLLLEQILAALMRIEELLQKPDGN